MKIAIDARELAGKPTGVGRYLHSILAAWNDLPGAAAHEYVLCLHRTSLHLHTLPNLRLSYVSAPHPRVGTLWEQAALPLLAANVRADVLFAPAYTGPLLARVPMVVTVHDVSFAAHPEWFSVREGLRRRVLTRLSARRAAKVITVSDFSKREIVRHLAVPHSRVEVIYSGITRLAAPGPRRTAEPLVLYAGSIFNRRHIPELIDGFGRLARRHPGVRLELVGDDRTRPPIDVDGLIAASPARDRIRARSYVHDSELAELYARASAFAFLSEYEGFAMTPLEALGAGIPVLLLDTEVAREIYGPGALYVPRADGEAIAGALERILFDEAERARLLAAAAVQIERYSWRECAQRTLQVLLACAGS